jgi:hypothetical protein
MAIVAFPILLKSIKISYIVCVHQKIHFQRHFKFDAVFPSLNNQTIIAIDTDTEKNS